MIFIIQKNTKVFFHAIQIAGPCVNAFDIEPISQGSAQERQDHNGDIPDSW